ncbi:DNA topoisomerase VI, B subunit [Geoglobus ahangari]|uniref:Type 2 DNA topoisomerase 6 subunit B n=1 Tax=Geoglobus ahangari TaxID=113653 RepID=A0A0F7IHJ8_9EURY|nr:DNA topoisomerase VI subunit B [Geoglobus ahangari]AKG92193.1 DNA topoisomerase VI, B subunit [Geoglobus ahangari]
MSSKHREISIAEFFEKNKHILGYSNPSKALITCVREAVDNSLDACEEAGILPDIMVKISKTGEGFFRIVVEDNGPGIERDQIPRVFGKLLYGSRFHAIKQSRGQQGIGISSAVLYAQITTGKPTVVTSKVEGGKAYRFELLIDTKKNEPEIVSEREVEWFSPHGTRIELEIRGSYVKERKQSVYEYLKETSVVNPHARITFITPDGEVHDFKRISDTPPEPPKEIKPHPHGIEIGTLMAMLKNTKARDLKNFLKTEFVRVGDKISEEILAKAGLPASMSPSSLSREDAERLINAFRLTDLLPPPVDCLSPIGESLIMKSLMEEYSPEFVYAVTRKPKVYSGHPFLVEAGIAYGGEIKEDKVSLLRFANKIPLLYQQSGCALTQAVVSVNWKNYGLQQSKNELPVAPAVILVHVASTNVPYVSESKEAVAAIPEIIEEVRLALQECGRRLKEYVERKKSIQKRKKKEEELLKIIPLLAEKISEVVEREKVDAEKVIARIMGKVYVSREVRDGRAVVVIHNFSSARRRLRIYEMCDGGINGDRTAKWDVEVGPGEECRIEYEFKGRHINRKPLVEGIEEEMLAGGEVVKLGY